MFNLSLIELFLLVFMYIFWSMKLLGDILGPVSSGVLATIFSTGTIIISYHFI